MTEKYDSRNSAKYPRSWDSMRGKPDLVERHIKVLKCLSSCMEFNIGMLSKLSGESKAYLIGAIRAFRDRGLIRTKIPYSGPLSPAIYELTPAGWEKLKKLNP